MVYFIQDSISCLIKIGSSDSLDRRLSALQTGCPGELLVLGLEDGGAEREKELHENFAHYRERGEWFRPGAGLIGYLIHRAELLKEEDHQQDSWSAGYVAGYQDALALVHPPRPMPKLQVYS